MSSAAHIILPRDRIMTSMSAGRSAFSGSESGNTSATVSDIYVYDTVVEAIGEQYMLTYAGGVFGGIWWAGSLTAENCAAIGSSVTASSVSAEAYAAGVSGLVQVCTMTGCHAVDTSVEAVSGTTAYAQAFSLQSRVLIIIVILRFRTAIRTLGCALPAIPVRTSAASERITTITAAEVLKGAIIITFTKTRRRMTASATARVRRHRSIYIMKDIGIGVALSINMNIIILWT